MTPSTVRRDIVKAVTISNVELIVVLVTVASAHSVIGVVLVATAFVLVKSNKLNLASRLVPVFSTNIVDHRFAACDIGQREKAAEYDYQEYTRRKDSAEAGDDTGLN